jgi:hypothetical protein
MPKPDLGRAPIVTCHVTKDIVATSVARNSNHCIMAEALKKALPHLKCLSVDIQTIRASDFEKGERYVYLTPRDCQVAIIDFDRGKTPKPFKFTLRAGQTIASGKNNRKQKPSAKAKMRRPVKGNRQSMLEVVGGVAPPRSIGQRRQFGLRALHY